MCKNGFVSTSVVPRDILQERKPITVCLDQTFLLAEILFLYTRKYIILRILQSHFIRSLMVQCYKTISKLEYIFVCSILSE